MKRLGGRSRKKCILLIEDEQPLAEVIADKLIQEHFEVITTKGTSQALDYLQNGAAVDAVWLDHYLFAHERGTNFVVLLKSFPQWKKLPVFVVTNNGNPRRRDEYLQLGVTRYFVKSEMRLADIVGEIILYFADRRSASIRP